MLPGKWEQLVAWVAGMHEFPSLMPCDRHPRAPRRPSPTLIDALA
jgi:hypothetical protein